jgi:hypothetical protein
VLVESRTVTILESLSGVSRAAFHHIDFGVTLRLLVIAVALMRIPKSIRRPGKVSPPQTIPLLWPPHRNQTISRRWANIISRRPSHGHLARRCCPQAFLRIFSEVTYIRTVRNSTLLKIYTLPNQTITIGVCISETQLLGLLYGRGASFVQKCSMPWMSANI